MYNYLNVKEVNYCACALQNIDAETVNIALFTHTSEVRLADVKIPIHFWVKILSLYQVWYKRYFRKCEMRHHHQEERQCV